MVREKMAQRDRAKDAALKEGSHLIQNAVMTYAADNGGAYPATDYVASPSRG